MLREFGEVLLPPNFHITYTTMKKYYPGEPVNIHIQIINKYYKGEQLGNYHQKRVRVNYHYSVVRENWKSPFMPEGRGSTAGRHISRGG